MAEKQLRVDQQGTIRRLDELLALGKRRVVVAAPTGFGKTLVAAELLKRELEIVTKVLFVVPAIALIDQTLRSFRDQGIEDVGVIQAYHEQTNWDLPVQVASVQTLQRRVIPPASFVIIDEVHRWFSFYEKWLMDPAWADVPIIGLSATPWTRGLGAYFTDLLVAGTTQEMIDAGHLSDFRVYAPSSPDLKGVRTVAGDYHEGDLSRIMDKTILTADIVDTWIRLGQDRPTLCFGVDRAHAKNLQNQFLARGVAAGYQDAYTNDEDRMLLRQRFHSGEIRVVCNVGTLTTGVDWDVRCIILARPTKSEMLFVQIVGRGLRNADGKDYCLLLDHSDNHLRLGFVTDIHYDKLDTGVKSVSSKTDKVNLPKKCPKCSYVKPPKTPICPACGFKAEIKPDVVNIKGELAELKRKKKIDDEKVWLDKRSIYGQLLTYARVNGKKDGWAYYKYDELYGEKPPYSWLGDRMIEPMPQVVSWIKSRNIAWAKGRGNADGGSSHR